MANQLGHFGISPRSYVRHLRYANFSHIRHPKQFEAFLDAQVARLVGVAGATDAAKEANVFAKLTKNTAAQVKGATSYTGLA